MATALLALVLLTAAVDPRLDEPLRLLAELHDASGEPIGAEYAQMPDTLDLILIVSSLPPRAGAHYQPSRRVVTVAPALLSEDPRVVAAGLVHELQHASDFDQVALGLLDRDCVELEARAFQAQAKVTRAFWPDDLPSGSEWERGLALTVLAYEREGLDGLRAMVSENLGYRERCAALAS
jgi:hypothetical protein